MADKAISDLVRALQINDSDLFVVEQNGVAKKFLGVDFKQYIAQIDINSIESVTFDAQNRCHIVLTDGTETISPSLKGPPGPQGPRGLPGVYVGSEEPEDDNILVWIDPDGEADVPATQEWVNNAIAAAIGAAMEEGY